MKWMKAILFTLLAGTVPFSAQAQGGATLIPPQYPARQIYLTADGGQPRDEFLGSLFSTLHEIQATDPSIVLPHLSIFEHHGRPFLDQLRVRFPGLSVDLHNESYQFCVDWPWVNSSNTWIRNWGVFITDGAQPLLMRMFDSCAARYFAKVASHSLHGHSRREPNLSFQGGNIREVSERAAIVGSANEKAWSDFFSRNALDRVRLDTSWLSQSDVDNLIAIVPGKSKILFVVPSPQKALDLLAKLPVTFRFKYHRPTRKEDYLKAIAGIPPTFMPGYEPDAYVNETTAEGFRHDLGAYNIQIQKTIDRQVAVLKAHYRLAQDQILSVPMLYGPNKNGLAVEVIPNPANGLALVLPKAQATSGPTYFLTSDTGIEAFNQFILSSLTGQAQVRFLNTWRLASEQGNVNCSTNVFRSR